MIEKYPPGGAKFDAGPFQLTAEKTAEGMTHRVRLREPVAVEVPEAVLPVRVAIGSGTRGRSYLQVEGSCVWQTPVSWFGPEQKWDVSPGFRVGRTLQRPIAPACLYCHTDAVQPIAGATNRYREPLFPRQVAVGCERCHGPGGLHAAERLNDPSPKLPDTSIVNPKHLSPALQRAVCEQCHLQGQERVNRLGRDPFQYRPGLPFEQFVSVYVRHPDIAAANKSVGQFEQMEQSQCFIKSEGKLTCTSCHDPHLAPAPNAKDAHYRHRCQSCHEGSGSVHCSATPMAREAKADSCIACHMPKAASSNIVHTSVTNHRVPRTTAAPPAVRPLPYGTVPLVRFRTGQGESAEENERDLGIALARYARVVSPQEAAIWGDPRVAAVGRLKAAVNRWPSDAEAWEALADAKPATDAAEKLRAAQKAVEHAPESESALAVLTEAATVAAQFTTAVETANKWVSLNPRSLDPYVARAFVHLKRSDWAAAEADCRAALKLNPLHPEARLYLAICLHHQGDPTGGKKQAEAAAQLEVNPQERSGLLQWYRRATR
ncbi:MAG: hypothetical protein MUF18_06350 [Fimbriiglobus sp.]|jgi:Flp pilus assembly protein TadD|nr:hypothetical protein [Fimbriiglobus sp.]